MPFHPRGPSGPFVATSADLSLLPRILHELGYRATTLAHVGLMPRRGQPALPLFEQLQRCEGGGPLELLCRLFVLALPQTVAQVDAALAPLGIAPLVECGLLRIEGDLVRAQSALVPIGEMILARDFSPLITGRSAADDHVLSVGAASVLTANLAVRRAGETMLDLGCGQGVQMILAQKHAARIIGTDITARALNFAAFNLAINANMEVSAGSLVAASRANLAPEIDLRLGSFFEPVEELRGKFDLIVSNPPFVITPAKDVVAYTSALKGDGAVETIFRNSPAFLADDGWCISLASWHHATPEDWASRPGAWVKDTNCDAFIVQLKSYHPRTYALKWIEETKPEHAPTAADVDEWMAMFDSLEAGAITFGFIALHKRAGNNWVQHESLEYDYQTGPAGEQLRNLFAGRTLLHELDAAGSPRDAVLDRPTQLAPDVRMTLQSQRMNGGWEPLGATLSTVPGISWPYEIDEMFLSILAALDGKLKPRQVLRKAAQQGEVDLAAAYAAGTALVRDLLERGILVAG